MSDDNLVALWTDMLREPRCAPDPRYPDGIALDLSDGAACTCETALPYPARRCGHYLIACTLCYRRVVVTTAGRPDDPNFVRVACKPLASAPPGHA